jgi:hypothetical protein
LTKLVIQAQVLYPSFKWIAQSREVLNRHLYMYGYSTLQHLPVGSKQCQSRVHHKSLQVRHCVH